MSKRKSKPKITQPFDRAEVSYDIEKNTWVVALWFNLGQGYMFGFNPNDSPQVVAKKLRKAADAFDQSIDVDGKQP